MSRTREIELWVEPDDIEALTGRADNSSVLRLYARQDAVSKNAQMVKLIQTLPERKVTISESEFDIIFKNFDHQVYRIDHVKEEIFKDAE